MMTGHAVEEVVKNCLEGGAYACLYKPYNPEQVINLIKEIIEQKKRETPS
jgi:DNA-binding NtrC family response regulator